MKEGFKSSSVSTTGKPKDGLLQNLTEDTGVEEKEISQAVVARLPRYLRYLG